MHRPGRRVWIAGAAMLILGGAVAVVLATTGSDGDLTPTARDSQVRSIKKFVNSHQHPNRPPGQRGCPDGTPEYHTHPAEILGNNAAGTTSEILIPVNVWTAGDCQQVTDIEAGAAARPGSLSDGIFVITRIRGSHAAGAKYVFIPDSGAVKITDAPLGPKVVTSAQSGELHFKGKRGVTGTLNLADDTATLSTGTVIQPTDRPLSGAG